VHGERPASGSERKVPSLVGDDLVASPGVDSTRVVARNSRARS
jgi:hypothetical protein